MVPHGEECENDSQCILYDPKSSCEEKICSCMKNYTLIDHTCHQILELGMHCESDDQCSTQTKNSICDKSKNKCLCAADYAPSNDQRVSD